MKLKVFPPEPEKDETIYLKLEQNRTIGDIILGCCDRSGAKILSGCLLVIHNDGSFSRPFGVDPELGFALDSEGRIQIK